MKAVLSIALGVIAAIGGFVDIGDLVFNAQAEAEGGVAPTKVKAVELADQISAALGRIQIAPHSETEGRSAEQTLNRLSKRAGQLADGL